MKLLLLTPQPPFPAHQGTAIRNWAILKHLAAQHRVTLLTFGDAASSATPEIRALCEAVVVVPTPARSLAARLLKLASGEADLAWRLWSPEFERALERLLANGDFDLVQVEGLELGQYVRAIRRCAPRVKTVYDAHNAEITIQRRALATDKRIVRRWPAALYSLLQMRPLARFEAGVCRAVDAVTAVSGADAATLFQLAPGVKPGVVPNGIDLEHYHPTPPQMSQPEILVFTGKMDYRPNLDAALWFANAVLPRLRSTRPAVQFQIVGQNPPPEVRRLQEQPGVTVTGAVEDTRAYIAGAAVFVAPLRMGGGTRFKLLEAMALARPIVSTRVGAEGFEVQSGRELLLADTPEEFAAAIERILDDQELARRLAATGRQFVERAYAWSALLPQLDAVHISLRPLRASETPTEAAR